MKISNQNWTDCEMTVRSELQQRTYRARGIHARAREQPYEEAYSSYACGYENMTLAPMGTHEAEGIPTMIPTPSLTLAVGGSWLAQRKDRQEVSSTEPFTRRLINSFSYSSCRFISEVDSCRTEHRRTCTTQDGVTLARTCDTESATSHDSNHET